MSDTLGHYNIVKITIFDTVFNRISEIDFSHQIVNTTNISREVSDAVLKEEGSKPVIIVNLTVELKGMQRDGMHQVYYSKVMAQGIFEKHGEPALPQENFAGINAPAIIYPFIREHIANLGLKAGISNVYLPPVNFMKKDQ